MSQIVTRSPKKQDRSEPREVSPSKNGIHYLDETKLGKILNSDMVLDKDGVFTKDHLLLDYCRRLAFSAFGEELSDQERARRGIEYKIDGDIGGTLGTIKGYNTGAPPVEAIIAVNRLIRDKNPDYKGISFAGLTQAQAFTRIFSFTDSNEILDNLRARYLRDSDRQLAQRMFEWYHENIYKHPTGARFMVEVPGSTAAVMDLYRHQRNKGRRLAVVTDTPDQETLERHMFAVGFTRKMILELREELLVVTQADVKNRKPHPEGLLKVKRPDVDANYIGDTVRDGEAAQRADIYFTAVLSGGSAKHTLEAWNPAIIANDLPTLAKQVYRV